MIATRTSARPLRSLGFEQRLLLARAERAHHGEGIDQGLVRRLVDRIPVDLKVVLLGEGRAEALVPSRSSATTRRGIAKRVRNFMAWTSPRHTRSAPEMPVGKPR